MYNKLVKQHAEVSIAALLLRYRVSGVLLARAGITHIRQETWFTVDSRHADEEVQDDLQVFGPAVS